MKVVFNTALAMLCLFAAKSSTAQSADSSNVTTEISTSVSVQTDTTGHDKSYYREQMRKLQAQMHDVQKQMNDLRAQEWRKTAEHMQQMGDRVNTRYNYNYTEGAAHTYTRGDDFIDKKIASGEVKEKTKTYTKSYPVSATDQVQIQNVFGKVAVNTWEKNEVKVDVEIKADGDDDASAQKILDKVSIKDGKDADGVSFKTYIEKNDEDNNWGSWTDSGKTHVKRVVVNYTVYMPAKNALNLSNKFGTVTVPDLIGKVSLNLNFSSLVAQQLLSPLNELNIRFGDANIGTLNSDQFNISYGNAKIGTADKLKAKVSFAGLNVDKLKTSGDITLKYTRGGVGLKVGELDKSLKALNVDASFSKVDLNADDDFDFDISTKMGGFDYNNASVNVTDKSPVDGERGYHPNKTYKGHAGKKGSNKTVTIKSSYTKVTLDK
ncbi:hypothetical protein [Mucilaginibacter agri]|uniref:Adhesin domain-containing protein n=1 Tax=Mucilaginibacter agri TaxID=2695265 RepID=A0A966DSL7_9SPHI|nr:hypothetical protein [Mucilaginibacter agri]NCD70283.1 hypothetical protein [Mucilaginibacter agri]